jgi:hypothetical protein
MRTGEMRIDSPADLYSSGGASSSSGKSRRCPPGDDADGHQPSLIRCVKVCG